MITIRNHVGRLIEGRFEGTLTAEQLKTFGGELADLMVKPPYRFVFVVDWRGCDVWSADIEVKLIGQARSDNIAIERSAFLIDPTKPVAAQVAKVVDLGRNPNRRSFTDLAALYEWVASVLTAEELARAKTFFAERAA